MDSMSGNSTTVNKGIFGIHHVTAITGDPQKNIDFYSNTLGLQFGCSNSNQVNALITNNSFQYKLAD
jgi:catechol 2,3-dioxygenase-like lactoylglutathione lyase family enzyme